MRYVADEKITRAIHPREIGGSRKGIGHSKLGEGFPEGEFRGEFKPRHPQLHLFRAQLSQDRVQPLDTEVGFEVLKRGALYSLICEG